MMKIVDNLHFLSNQREAIKNESSYLSEAI